jgi:hypothetical protein
MEEQKEDESGVISLTLDMGYDTGLSFIKYLYTDDTEISLDNSIPLLKAADQYQVERLKLLCESTISSCISDVNVSSLLLEADKHSAETL